MKINYSFEIYSFLGSKPDPKEIYSLVKHRYINTSFPCILSSTIANTLQVFLKHHNQISSLILIKILELENILKIINLLIIPRGKLAQRRK